MLYYKGVLKKRRVPLDQKIARLVREISTERPAYGTRRLAAVVSRKTGTRVNRKQVQRICRKTGLLHGDYSNCTGPQIQD